MLIVITGLDGSGTSTIAEELHRKDKGSILLKTPSDFYKDRNYIDSNLHAISPVGHMLYYLSSTVSMSDYIKNNFDVNKQNIYVVRYLIDTVVSNRVRGIDIDLDYNIYGNEILKPDLTVFVSIDEELRQKRITDRGKSYLDKILDDEVIRNKFINEFDRLLDKNSTIYVNNDSNDIDNNIKGILEKINI